MKQKLDRGFIGVNMWFYRGLFEGLPTTGIHSLGLATNLGREGLVTGGMAG